MTGARKRPLAQGKITRRPEWREPRRRLLVVCGGCYWPRLGEAVGRAKKLDPAGTVFTANPSTNMWQLVEAIGWGRPG